MADFFIWTTFHSIFDQFAADPFGAQAQNGPFGLGKRAATIHGDDNDVINARTNPFDTEFTYAGIPLGNLAGGRPQFDGPGEMRRFTMDNGGVAVWMTGVGGSGGLVVPLDAVAFNTFENGTAFTVTSNEIITTLAYDDIFDNGSPPNTAPEADDETFDIDENQVLDDTADGSDAEGVSLRFTLIDDVLNGTLVLRRNGDFVYTPNQDFSGEDSFSYSITDGALTDTATVTINVANTVPSPPVVGDDEFTIDEDSAIIDGSVADNDVDPEGGPLTFEVVAGPAEGVLEFNEADGTFTYTPPTDLNGQQSFTYRALDNEGLSAEGTVTINITPVPDDPEFGLETLEVAFTEDEMNGSLTIIDVDLTATDVDAPDVVTSSISAVAVTDGDPGALTDEQLLSFVDLVNADTGTTTALEAGETTAALRVDYAADGPVFDFLNAADTLEITYTLRLEDDTGAADTADLIITVTGQNDAPTGADDAVTTDEDTAFTLDIADLLGRFSDVDRNDVLTVQGVDDSQTTGLITFDAQTGITYNPNGAFETLAAGDVATDRFFYTVQDAAGASDAVEITVTITGENDDPTVSITPATGFTEDDEASAQDLSDAGTVSFDDIDAGDVIDISFASQAAVTWSDGQIDGTLAAALLAGFQTGVTDATVPGATPWTYEQTGLDLDFLGAEEEITWSYLVTATDSQHAEASVEIGFTITGTNDAPSVEITEAAGFEEAEDASAQDLSDAGTVTFDDLDANDVVDIDFESNGDIAWSDGTLDPGFAQSLVDGFSTGISDAAAPGETPWTYDVVGADLDFLGAGEEITWSYTVIATDNQHETAETEIGFTITGTNDAPVFTETSLTLTENGAALGEVAVTDLDAANPRESLDFAITGGADASLFSLTEGGALAFVVSPDFEDPQDADGDNIYEVELEVTDPEHATDTQTFLVEVLDDVRDDAPVEPGQTLIAGTSGNNLLRGTSGDDVFRATAGARDLLDLTQGGADTIQFFGETTNGIVEIDFVIGFGADDVIDLGGTQIAETIQSFGRLTMVLEGDGDRIVLTGVNDFDFDTQIIG